MSLALSVATPRPAGAAESVDDPRLRAPRLGDLVVALDELVARARPDGGWTFAHPPGKRVRPNTAPLRFAERVAAPLGLADWDVVVIRSPGTPAAILTLLAGYRLTGDARYLATAVRAGELLAAIQMRWGGWFSEMPVHGAAPARWFDLTVRRTALDDDVTSGAIRALLALWETTGDARFRASAERGLALLLDRQLASGAWPLVARPRWKQWVWPDFEDYATLNDATTTQIIVTLLAGWRALGRDDFLAAARRGGAWIVGAQRPPPQAGWAQQYDEDGKPVPARRYERVALASWESRFALEALLALAAATGDTARWCAPFEPAVRWLESVRLAPGCWARFYELGSNQPLYFDEQRRVVGSAAEAHQPYDWTGDFGIPDLLLRVSGASTGVETTARLPGDPGACPNRAAKPFDPRTARDPRHVIAYAGRVAATLEAPPPAACRVAPDELLSSGR